MTKWEPEGPDQVNAKASLYEWTRASGTAWAPSLVISGEPGTGKTFLGCGILNDLFKGQIDGRYIQAMDYTGKIKESYRKNSKEPESAIKEQYAAAPILVLDELGRQFESESEKIYLFSLINERYNRKHPTLFLTNLGIAEISAFFEKALLDRLREGGGKILEFNWPSRRK